MAGTLVVAGGGTAGHVFPGLAIARVLLEKDADRVLFVGTSRGLEATLVAREHLPFEAVRAAGAVGKNPLKAIAACWETWWGMRAARRILRRERPRLVLGVGGYVSLPVTLAARAEKVPVVIQEANVAPGVANRIAARWAREILLPFDAARAAFGGRGVVTGNPVREDVVAKARNLRAQRAAGAPFTLLITGGSQGAAVFNERMAEALAQVADAKSWRIVHQAGRNRTAGVEARYRDAGVAAEVVEFLHDMGAALGQADLVVCRAGASAVGEVAAIGMPSILVPLPTATHDHQTRNARVLADAGAAVLLLQADFTAQRMAQELARLGGDAPARASMAAAAESLGAPGAARRAADILKEYFA